MEIIGRQPQELQKNQHRKRPAEIPHEFEIRFGLQRVNQGNTRLP